LSGLKDILLNFGAIAGFAGIIGLAVLAMLYFSQARDVRRLREWAGREPERAGEIELRAQQIASQAIAQAYESMALRQSEASAAAGIAQDAGHEISSAPLVAADAGQTEVAGAPLVQHDPQATQAHDVVAHEFGEETDVDEAAHVVLREDAEPREALSAEADSQHADEEHADAEHAPYEVAAAAATVGETAVQPAPPEHDGSEPDDADESDQNLLQPSTPAAARAAAPLPPLPPLDTSEFTAVRGPSTPPIPDYYLSTGATGSGHFEAVDPPAEHRSRVPFAVAGVLVAIFAVILIGTQLIGGNDTNTPTNSSAGSAGSRATQNTSTNRNPRINRAAVTVAVLNGTQTAGIAATAASGLNKAGFTDTTIGNLPDGGQRPTTTVYYAPGSKQEAQEVGSELAVKDVKPATEDVLANGGSVPVIVVLGANFGQ
jgi:hypothetical protein